MKIVSIVSGDNSKVAFGKVYEKIIKRRQTNEYLFIGIYNFETGEIDEKNWRKKEFENTDYFYSLNEKDLKHFVNLEKFRREKIIDNILK